MRTPIPVAVLAATGSVGQRFVQLLTGHPWFRIVALTGSDSKVGQRYGEACRWILPDEMPAWAARFRLTASDPDALGVPLVFSALPAAAARDIEARFARAGVLVCSNASAYRRDPGVPILLPEINPDHTDMIRVGRVRHGWSGGIVTNPNCTSAGISVALKALRDAFGVRKVFVVSMQALSGAGFPGVASLDVLDNIVPYVDGEEEKVEWEPRKILGTWAGEDLQLADFQVSVHANRVPVSDGHLACLSVALDRRTTIESASQVLAAYQAPQVSRDLPSAPSPVIAVRPEADRPQPRLDRMAGAGMTTVVGRVRPDLLFDLKLVVLSHNTIRGAAGGSIYNAELLVREGWLGG